MKKLLILVPALVLLAACNDKPGVETVRSLTLPAHNNQTLAVVMGARPLFEQLDAGMTYLVSKSAPVTPTAKPRSSKTPVQRKKALKIVSRLSPYHPSRTSQGLRTGMLPLRADGQIHSATTVLASERDVFGEGGSGTDVEGLFFRRGPW
ncbi:hypothetical protein P2W49_05720 [Yersinia intermedia]|nr:hypothetical protein P2W49_05720 [Yersinia intermedia]